MTGATMAIIGSVVTVTAVTAAAVAAVISQFVASVAAEGAFDVDAIIWSLRRLSEHDREKRRYCAPGLVRRATVRQRNGQRAGAEEKSGLHWSSLHVVLLGRRLHAVGPSRLCQALD
jgi:hypothetical protein